MAACQNTRHVLDKLAWMRPEGIWLNQKYLWTDAFGVVLLISLHAESGERRYLDQAEWVVAEVDRVLGRPCGIRVGEVPDHDGQYFHYLAMWLYALSILGRHLPDYSRSARDLQITQDLGLGMMLWMSQFFPDEGWARAQKARCFDMLDRMWVEDGYFCREPGLHQVKFAFTNYGVSGWLQAVNAMPERIQRLNAFFETYRSGDKYDREALTHVMACSSYFPGNLIRGFG